MTDLNLAAGDIGAYAKTLAANIVDTVTFPRDLDQVEVLSDGAAALYFTVDGSTPTIAGQATYELPAGIKSKRTVTVRSAGNTVVKLLSTGTPKYSVNEP